MKENKFSILSLDSPVKKVKYSTFLTGYTQEVEYDYTNQSYSGTGQAPTVGRTGAGL